MTEGRLQPDEDDNDSSTGLPHFILREISALVDLRGNANIVELVDIFEIANSKKIVLSFRYEEGGDLNGLLYQ